MLGDYNNSSGAQCDVCGEQRQLMFRFQLKPETSGTTLYESVRLLSHHITSTLTSRRRPVPIYEIALIPLQCAKQGQADPDAHLAG